MLDFNTKQLKNQDFSDIKPESVFFIFSLHMFSKFIKISVHTVILCVGLENLCVWRLDYQDDIFQLFKSVGRL